MTEELPIRVAVLPDLSEKAKRAMSYRIGLFKRRGMSEECAEAWARRLVLRDIERDDRHICFECSKLQCGGGSDRDGPVTCAVKVPKKKPTDWQRFLLPVPFVLQRCGAFSFQKPS